MKRKQAVPTHWVDGRIHDAHPSPVTPWQQILAVLLLLCLFDFALGQRSAPAQAAGELDATQLRATLDRARAHAEDGRRSILLIGDSVLAGNVLASDRPNDWASQRVVEHLRRELAPWAKDSVDFEQVALDGLLPVDALQLVTELDRLDPAGEVELVIELNLRFFSKQYAQQSDCTRPAVCALGRTRVDRRTLASAWDGVAAAAIRARDRLLEHTPVHRHRDRTLPSLDRLPGLAVARDGHAAAPEQGEAIARVSEHYRSAVVNQRAARRHAQLAALLTLLDRASASQRKVTLFLTPLADSFARRSFGAGVLGRRYAALAKLINDYQDPEIALLDLDHPLFGDGHFIDHVHLDADGSRLLALNLLHELNLPLAQRPFEQQMVHPEGHDRTLVHRVELGYEEGGAWQARFDKPEAVAVDRAGTRIVIADTQNHVLRQLRGNMQFVETIAGEPRQAGFADGPADAALLDSPRGVELLGESVWFIDGAQRQHLRVLERGSVHTVKLRGPSCAGYQTLRARAEAIWALCSDNRLLRIDPAEQRSTQLFAGAPSKLVSFDLGVNAIYFADAKGRLWRRPLLGRDQLGGWDNVFRNSGAEPLPHGHRVGYPYAYDQLRLTKVVDLRFVDRYGGLLVADELTGKPSKFLTERTQLRYFDLDAERILPWIKPIPHGEAHALYNQHYQQVVSYWHLGSMAIAQDDASLIWLEQRRSRLLRIADGLLGVAKSGNHHTRKVTIPLLQTLAGVSRRVEAQLRPDRYLHRRHEPLPRKGPHVALLCGSSLSSMSDRLSNYSLGRRLELELSRELGYRDLVRLDLFQLSAPAASFADSVNNLANWMKTSVPPDVVLIEAHDLGGSQWFLRDSKTQAEVLANFKQLRELADRYQTLVVFYDLSSLEANRRDGMRSTDAGTRELLDQAERLGFVVLDPGDRLFRELLRHSPWANQPFDENQHHGATWAVDLTAQTLAAMLHPTLREFLRDRTPARLRERPPSDWDGQRTHDPLRAALERVPIAEQQLVRIEPGYVQTELVGTQLRVYVDLAGFGDAGDTELDTLAVAVIHTVLRDDIYAEFAETLRLELVEFVNYDEYGNGVLESAKPRWQRSLDREQLEQFLRANR